MKKNRTEMTVFKYKDILRDYKTAGWLVLLSWLIKEIHFSLIPWGFLEYEWHHRVVST